MMSLEEAIEHAEKAANDYEGMIDDYALDSEKLAKCAAEHRQLAAWLRELQERRKVPEIIRCGECKHNNTPNCLLNLWATIFNSKPKDDFFCGMAERKTDND